MVLESPGVDFQTAENELFTRTYFKYRNAKSRFCVVYGGASSGKSYAIHQYELIQIMKSGIGDTLVMRKNGADIRDSSYKLFTTLIAEYNLGDYFRCVYGGDHKKITCLANGRAILFRGIDEPEKLKSIVGIKRIVMEEASQFDVEDLLELNRRARGMDNIQITLILNPISENHWIKKKMCDETGEYYCDTTLIKTTYKDNCNLNGKSFVTDIDIRQLENLKLFNENQYRIYVLGEWGIENKESKFVWAFTNSQCVPTQRDYERILWATFDFNVNPLTCTIAQVFEEEQLIRAIECIKLENSDMWKMCERLIASYPDAMWNITGDQTGMGRDVGMKDNTNYYHIIQGQLRIAWQQIIVPSKNPIITENRLLVNAVHRNWTVEIDPEHCKELIYDLNYVEVDGQGKILKDRGTTAKFADFLDNWRYLINVAVKPHFNFMNMGDEE